MERIGFGIDDQAFADGESACRGGLWHHPNGAVRRILHPSFDEAHSAHSDGLQARVIAENRDFKTEALHGFDDQFAFGNRKFDSVDDDIDGLDVGRRCHGVFYEALMASLA